MKKYAVLSLGFAALAILLIVMPVFADTKTPPQSQRMWGQQQGMHNGFDNNGMRRGPQNMMRPVVIGTVSSVSGTSLTVQGKQGFGSTTATTTFSVDASHAIIIKNNATTTISNIAQGDMVAILGTTTGSTISATMIRDGITQFPGRGRMGMMGTSTPNNYHPGFFQKIGEFFSHLFRF